MATIEAMDNKLRQDEISERVIAFAEEHGLGQCKEYKDFHSKVCNADKKDRFFGLMSVFDKDLGHSKLKVQTFAGRMLLKINPKPLETCEESIFRLLKNWNVSAEEVIYYLANQHGKKNVLSAINMMKTGQVTSRESAMLNSMRFFLGN